MKAVDRFRELSTEKRFQGWPVEGIYELGQKIPFFGQPINYKLRTGNGVEDYTSIVRHFGWAVTFGVTSDKNVITLAQWKPGVNRASWELPPGGIGKVAPRATIEEITSKTQEVYLRETGYSQGLWAYLGNITIETGKYRGAGPDEHGLDAHLFLAKDLAQATSGARKPNPNEIMETVMVPLPEFREVLESGFFTEESAVACAYKALVKLNALRWIL